MPNIARADRFVKWPPSPCLTGQYLTVIVALMDASELKTTVDMAMLELDDAQIAAFEGAVEQMLEYFAVMASVDVDHLPPTTHALGSAHRVRPDVLRSETDPDSLLDNAPDLEDRLVAIPNVL